MENALASLYFMRHSTHRTCFMQAGKSGLSQLQMSVPCAEILRAQTVRPSAFLPAPAHRGSTLICVSSNHSPLFWQRSSFGMLRKLSKQPKPVNNACSTATNSRHSISPICADSGQVARSIRVRNTARATLTPAAAKQILHYHTANSYPLDFL